MVTMDKVTPVSAHPGAQQVAVVCVLDIKEEHNSLFLKRPVPCPCGSLRQVDQCFMGAELAKGC